MERYGTIIFEIREVRGRKLDESVLIKKHYDLKAYEGMDVKHISMELYKEVEEENDLYDSDEVVAYQLIVL